MSDGDAAAERLRVTARDHEQFLLAAYCRQPEPNLAADVEVVLARLAEVERERDELTQAADSWRKFCIEAREQLTQAREALSEIAVHVDRELQTPTFNSLRRVVETVDSIARQALATINREGETG